MLAPRATNVLLVYPRFAKGAFWNFQAACELFGAKYPTAPLGLITAAAMLPSAWAIRLVDRNTEDLNDADLDWADLVMTGGMLPQLPDLVEIIDMCRARNKPIAIGGPGVTSVPYAFTKANFQILGEAEAVIDDFVAAWEAGVREGVFEAPKFTIDVTKTPIPRFDLLKFDDYLYVGVQFSRGCPFTCEFCDIIELYGRVPRTKTTPQMLAELDRLYELGYRGHVDFVDDNLIGNKKAVKAFLPDLKKWLEEHDYPFEFTTEASINLADDPELLRLMNEANFVGVFVGIESPDPETLRQMKKKQNTRRSIPDSIHKIYAAGMFVTAGFIVGFDNEKGSIAGRDGGADRGCGDPGRDGRPALRAAEHPVDAPAGTGRPAASASRVLAEGRHVYAGPQLRHQAAAPRNPAGLPQRPGKNLRSHRLCGTRQAPDRTSE